MSDTERKTRVITIGEPGSTQQQIIAALSASAQSEFELVDVLVPSENLIREARAANPEIILIDHHLGEESILDLIDNLGSQFADPAILAIIPSNDPLIAQQIMLAGARAFIAYPFTQVNLLSTLRRIRDLEARRVTSQTITARSVTAGSRPIKTITIYSPRGGTGCTTIAVNLAIAIKEKTNQRILLMGGKLLFGHLDLMLNIRSNNTIGDLIPHAAHMDETLVRDVVSRHVSGIDVLFDPFDIQISQGIRPQELFNVIEGLQRVYDLIIVDAGSALNENTVTLMDVADRIMLVANPDLSSLSSTSRFIQISRSLSYPNEKILFVLNRSDMVGGVKTKDITSSVHAELYAEIPDGGTDVLRSLNRGIPLILKYPRNPTTRSLQKLADKISNLAKLEEIIIPQDGLSI